MIKKTKFILTVILFLVSFSIPAFAAIDKEAVLEIAKKKLTEMYGAEKVKKEEPFNVELIGDVWVFGERFLVRTESKHV